MSGPAAASLFVDRIEGDRAVLLVDGDQVAEIPAALLPPGAGEGSWLTCELSLDPTRTERMRDAVSALRARLAEDDDGGDLVL